MCARLGTYGCIGTQEMLAEYSAKLVEIGLMAGLLVARKPFIYGPIAGLRAREHVASGDTFLRWYYLFIRTQCFGCALLWHVCRARLHEHGGIRKLVTMDCQVEGRSGK